MDITTSPTGTATGTSRTSSTLAIEASGLHKKYGETTAVESLDLEVETGTVLGFLGPNGAGKTTVIRMLSTILAPDRGSFTVAGLAQSRPTEIRRLIGVLPEGAGYPPAQTAEEWLIYHSRLFGAQRRAARDNAHRLLSEVGLEERGGSRIAGLSRGLRQRLGIARALVNNPQVVFLDEPTLGLDPAGQRQVLALVARIAREHGVTVMLSTHTLAEVEQICSRVLILNRGRVVADGTVAEIVSRAGAPRRAVVQVPPDLRPRTIEVLAEQRMAAVATANGRHDEVELTLPAKDSPEHSAQVALGCLIAAGVPVLGFTLEGGRLSDAFLAVTGDAHHD